ncbi:MAG: aspartate carbamoyltransferase catalytic subunit [Pseudomonadota bacterium]
MSVTRSRTGPPSLPRRERPESWERYLDRDEKLVWEGEPSAGIRVRGADILQSVFGLFFGGFAIFWVTMASGMSAGRSFQSGGIDMFATVFPLFGVPFILVGAYMVFGQYLWKAYVRGRTRYALTNKRAIIAKSALGRSLKSWPIDGTTRLELQPGREATIWFAEEQRRGSKGRRYSVKKGFEYIPDGEEVYRLMRRIQQGEA